MQTHSVMGPVVLVIFTLVLLLSRLSLNLEHSISKAAVTGLALILPIKESIQPGMVHIIPPLSFSVSYFREVKERAKRQYLQPKLEHMRLAIA